MNNEQSIIIDEVAYRIAVLGMGSFAAARGAVLELLQTDALRSLRRMEEGVWLPMEEEQKP